MLLHEGVSVSGSDLVDGAVLDTLRGMGAYLSVSQAGENIPPDTEMLIISAAVRQDNPEVVEARRRGMEIIKYASALGLLMREKTGVAVSGTHGKTTTTAMLAVILTSAGMDPSFVVGATVPQLATSSREGAGDAFVVEACEYDRSFLNLHPQIAVINNIEEDHLDYYGGLEEIVEAFREFAGLLDRDGVLVGNAHDRNAMSVLSAARCRRLTFGAEVEADWQAVNLDCSDGAYCFDVMKDALMVGRMRLAIPGLHNVLNSLAAVAVADELGVDFVASARALEDFCGAERRFSIVGKAAGVTVIDDYAHHPTEIQVTLKAARDCYDSGRIWVVFQPHQYSRTRFFLKDFARSFAQVDRIIVPDIYFVRDSDRERKLVNARDLVTQMRGLGYHAEYIPEWRCIIDRIISQARPGDVVITMGAGNVNEVADALFERLEREAD